MVWFGKLNLFFSIVSFGFFKWSLQYVFEFANPMILCCDSKKKCNTFSTLYFAERNWKKMRTSITMNVFCTAASSKYWRMRIDLDFIWLLHTIFGKLLMQSSGNHVSPRKRHSQDFHYLHNWHKLRLKFFPLLFCFYARKAGVE